VEVQSLAPNRRSDRTGTVAAGMKSPRLKDVAEAAGVHPATASRALDERRSAMVRAETVQRVRQAASDLGYRVNRMARGLKMNRSFTIGMLIPDITNPFFPPIVRGAEDCLGEAGYTLILGNTDNDEAKERRHVAGMLERQVDGLLLATARRQDPLVDELRTGAAPLVLVNHRPGGRDGRHPGRPGGDAARRRAPLPAGTPPDRARGWPDGYLDGSPQGGRVRRGDGAARAG
jgi:hypothetical protein